MYSENDLNETMKDLLKNTKFYDFVFNNLKDSLNEDEKKVWKSKKEDAIKTLNEYNKDIPIDNHDNHTILVMLIDHHSEELDKLIEDKILSIDYLKEKYGVY